jgi:hypothetical protein
MSQQPFWTFEADDERFFFSLGGLDFVNSLSYNLIKHFNLELNYLSP